MEHEVQANERTTEEHKITKKRMRKI